MAGNFEGLAHSRNMKAITRKQWEQHEGVAVYCVCLHGTQVASHKAEGFGTITHLAHAPPALHPRHGPY